jgi:hypothetical protein
VARYKVTKTLIENGIEGITEADIERVRQAHLN